MERTVEWEGALMWLMMERNELSCKVALKLKHIIYDDRIIMNLCRNSWNRRRSGVGR